MRWATATISARDAVAHDVDAAVVRMRCGVGVCAGEAAPQAAAAAGRTSRARAPARLMRPKVAPFDRRRQGLRGRSNRTLTRRQPVPQTLAAKVRAWLAQCYERA